jgi:uncharacterized protein with PQ loop repeat
MLDVFQAMVILQQIGFTIAYIPQIVKLLTTKKSDDISVTFFIIRVTSLSLLECVYIMLNQPILYYSNLLSIIPEVVILFLVITNKYEFRKRHDKEKYGF